MKAQLYDADFTKTLTVLLIPIALLTVIGFVAYFFDDLKPLFRSKEARLWHTTPEPDR